MVYVVGYLDSLTDAIRRGDVKNIEKNVRLMAEDERKREAVEGAIKKCGNFQGSLFWTCIAEVVTREGERPPSLVKMSLTPERV